MSVEAHPHFSSSGRSATADEHVYDLRARAGAIAAGLTWSYALDQDDEVELDCFIVRPSARRLPPRGLSLRLPLVLWG